MYLLLFFLALATTGLADLKVKKLAGPPSEFSQYVPASPSAYPAIQHSAIYNIDLAPNSLYKGELSKNVELAVDSSQQFSFIIFSSISDSLVLSLSDPNSNPVQLNATQTFMPIGDDQLPGLAYIIPNPIPGVYLLSIKTTSISKKLYNKILSNTNYDVIIISNNEDDIAMHTSLNTFSFVTGNRIGLVSLVLNVSEYRNGVLMAKRGYVTNAEMNVVLPDGQSINEPMFDDGLSDDGEENDGVYGALITATVSGTYIFSATINATNEQGINFARTTQQLVSVVDPTLTLTGSATGTLDSQGGRINVNIGVVAPSGNKYKVYAEVWGLNNNTQDQIPVSWIGGMAFVQNDFLTVELDLNWISMAGASEPLTLKNVAIRDPGTSVIIAEAAEISVKSDLQLDYIMAKLDLLGKDDEITDEMRVGRKPARNHTRLDSITPYVLLVHGYCSQTNPYLAKPSYWKNALYYSDYGANKPNDQFAQEVMTWAEAYGVESCAYVGHSQGGMVGLHILDNYWSCIDEISGGYVIQSVGTPYYGCSAAGSAASLGKAFGAGCGANADLSTNALWIGTITNHSRQSVNYYTSSYKLGQIFGDYCNLAMQAVLDFPNDGTCEFDKAQLSGGNNKGNKEQWCHTTGMHYTSECQDTTRLASMSANVAKTPL